MIRARGTGAAAIQHLRGGPRKRRRYYKPVYVANPQTYLCYILVDLVTKGYGRKRDFVGLYFRLKTGKLAEYRRPSGYCGWLS